MTSGPLLASQLLVPPDVSAASQKSAPPLTQQLVQQQVPSFGWSAQLSRTQLQSQRLIEAMVREVAKEFWGATHTHAPESTPPRVRSARLVLITDSILLFFLRCSDVKIDSNFCSETVAFLCYSNAAEMHARVFPISTYSMLRRSFRTSEITPT